MLHGLQNEVCSGPNPTVLYNPFLFWARWLVSVIEAKRRVSTPHPLQPLKSTCWGDRMPLSKSTPQKTENVAPRCFQNRVTVKNKLNKITVMDLLGWSQISPNRPQQGPVFQGRSHSWGAGKRLHQGGCSQGRWRQTQVSLQCSERWRQKLHVSSFPQDEIHSCRRSEPFFHQSFTLHLFI